MQDSQDNTFPIPQADISSNQVGGPVPPASNDQMPTNPVPGATNTPSQNMAEVDQTSPAQTAQPPQPDWATVAEQDNAALNQPAPTIQPDTSQAPELESINQNNSYPQSQPDNLANKPVPNQSIPQYNSPTTTAQPPLAEPAPETATQTPVAPAVPSSNMLDLSNSNPVSSAPPAPQVPPSEYAQPGALQPGVDVNPNTGMPLPEETGGIPPGFGGNLGLGDMAAPVPPSPNNKKKFIIIGAVVLGVILILSLVLVLASRNKKSPAVELNQDQVEQTQQATESTDTQPAAIPEGFKKADRDCYSFGILLPTTLNFSNLSCKISAKFGSVSQYEITVTPVTNSVTDLQALVDQAKVGTITSQNDIKLNNVAAKQVIQKVNGLDQQTIVVIPNNKNYQLDGQVVNGFIINTSYNDDTAKKASETLVSTWTWK